VPVLPGGTERCLSPARASSASGRGVGVARLASSVEVLLRVLIEATQDFEAKPQAGLHPWVPRRRCRLGAFPAHPSELTHEVLAQHPIEGIVSGWQ